MSAPYILEAMLDGNMTWYRGVPKEPRLAIKSISRYEYYTGAKPDPLPEGIPAEIEDAYNAGRIREVRGLYPGTEFTYGRTYSGMSNFGFGVYFSNDLGWALRYGKYVVAAHVDPNHIHTIRWDERKEEGTGAHELLSYVYSKSSDMDYREQMPHFRSFVLRRKKKKALFVETGDGIGQMVVYQPDYIDAICLADFK